MELMENGERRQIRAVGGGADVTFDGATVSITPTTPETREQFGTGERIIDINDVTALSFSAATIFRKEGKFMIADTHGETVLLFTRKANYVMRLISNVISVRAPSTARRQGVQRP